MRLFSRSVDGVTIVDTASSTTAVIGLLPGRPLGEAPLVVGVQRTVRGASGATTASFGLGPFEGEAEAYDAFVDVFVDRFKRFPDGAMGQEGGEDKGLLRKVKTVIVPRPLSRELGFLVLGVAWRAADGGENVTTAVGDLWKRLKRPTDGENMQGALSAPKADGSRRAMLEKRRVSEGGTKPRVVEQFVPCR